MADDDSVVGEVLRRMLSRAGYAVDLFQNGQEALAAFDPSEHRLLVLDNNMPLRSGLEVIRSLRGCGVRVPVVLVSGHLDEATRRACVEAGRVEAIRKPFTLLGLEAAIRTLTLEGDEEIAPLTEGEARS